MPMRIGSRQSFYGTSEKPADFRVICYLRRDNDQKLPTSAGASRAGRIGFATSADAQDSNEQIRGVQRDRGAEKQQKSRHR